MIIPAPEAVAFSIFSFPVYWYGICLAMGIFMAIVTGNFLFNLSDNNVKKDAIISSAPAIIISGIVGARLYFCMLNPSYYFVHPLEILDIRQGGLSIHGALIFGILALIISAKKNKVSVLSVLDSIACGTILGQAIGRWGNYFNSEAYGLPVKNQNWGLFIPEDRRIAGFYEYSLFHPTFLYECILNLVAFAILVWVFKRFGRKYLGLTFFVYLFLYSIIRFFIEQVRIDSALNIDSIPIAILMSGVFFIISLVGMFVIIFKNSKLDSDI